MRLVKESDPLAYGRHPYWSGLDYGHECGGDDLKTYVVNQGTANGERQIMDTLVMLWTATGGLMVMYSLLKRRTLSVSGLVTVAASVLISLLAATTLLMHTHFNVDITMMAGGIMHHAFDKVPGINDAGGSVTEGYLLNGAFNRVFYVAALYLLVTRDSRLKGVFDPYLLIGLFQLFMWVALKQVGRNHPIYHEWAKDGATPEMMSALPYTSMWRAYKHCIVHHDNGLSFSGDFFLDPLYDAYLYAFAYIHNTLLRIPLGSAAHYVVSTASDAFMSVLNVFLLYVALRAGSLVIPHYSSFVLEGEDNNKKKAL